ncbi:hypothetical protein BKA18_000227 [Streptomyces auratus]
MSGRAWLGHRRHRPRREHPRQHRGHRSAGPGRRPHRRHRPQGPGLVDRGFKQVARHGNRLDISVDTVERNPQDKGFVPQPERWRVEQTYGILILHRRLVRDHEHRPSSSASRVYWAMTHVTVRRLTDANTATWRDLQSVAT